MYIVVFNILFFCFKQKTAYEMRISDWSSDVCSSDLDRERHVLQILFALRRGDHDVAVVVGVGLLCERGPRRAQDRAAEQKSAAGREYCRKLPHEIPLK